MDKKKPQPLIDIKNPKDVASWAVHKWNTTYDYNFNPNKQWHESIKYLIDLLGKDLEGFTRAERCEECNGELSQCGPQNVDGEPSLDCRYCRLQETVKFKDQALTTVMAEVKRLHEAYPKLKEKTTGDIAFLFGNKKMKLKPFGVGGLSYNWGFTLPILVGHLENLVDQEGCEIKPFSKNIKTKRFEKAEQALNLLNEVLAMGNEE